jgi:hypothetical protein
MEAQTSGVGEVPITINSSLENKTTITSIKQLDLMKLVSKIHGQIIVSMTYLFIVASLNSLNDSNKFIKFTVSLAAVFSAYKPMMFFIEAVKSNFENNEYRDSFVYFFFMVTFFSSLVFMLFR